MSHREVMQKGRKVGGKGGKGRKEGGGKGRKEERSKRKARGKGRKEGRKGRKLNGKKNTVRRKEGVKFRNGLVSCPGVNPVSKIAWFLHCLSSSPLRLHSRSL